MKTLYQLRQYEQEDGKVIPIELLTELPFVPKRVFFISEVPPLKYRGNHAHRKCEQFIVVLAGRCSVRTIRGEAVETWSPRSEISGLYVPALTWVIIENISADAVICVFASEVYDVNDYIDSFDEYKALEQQCRG